LIYLSKPPHRRAASSLALLLTLGGAVLPNGPGFASWLHDGGPALLKPAANDVLQRWPVSRRVNSSRAPADDPSLIERVEVT